MTTYLIIIAVVLVVFMLFVAFVLAASKSKQQSTNDYQAKALLTENEKEFFVRLVIALPEHVVFTQVAMGAILNPSVPRNDKRFIQIRGRFAQKIVDFVVCDRFTLNVIAIVELDDRTHKADCDQKRDAMLESAGYRVIRWNSRNKPSAEEIMTRVTQTLA